MNNDSKLVLKTPVSNLKSQNEQTHHGPQNNHGLTTEKYEEILLFLSSTYPHCFPSPPLPLSIGIHKELYIRHKDRFSRLVLKRFLRRYSRKNLYRKAHTIGAKRFDLEGNTTSLVTQEQIDMTK